MRGEYTEAELITPINEGDDEDNSQPNTSTDERLCEALFYVGEAYWARGQPDVARDYFAALVNIKVIYFLEHGLALAEIAKLQGRCPSAIGAAPGFRASERSAPMRDSYSGLRHSAPPKRGVHFCGDLSFGRDQSRRVDRLTHAVLSARTLACPDPKRVQKCGLTPCYRKRETQPRALVFATSGQTGRGAMTSAPQRVCRYG